MRPNEMMMSDVPAAVAWYGRRPCTALTEDTGVEFFQLNDEFKSVKALYLTPRTVDSRLISQMVKEKKGWGNFLLEYLTRNQPPEGFPLRVAARGSLPEQFFLTVRDRGHTSSP